MLALNISDAEVRLKPVFAACGGEIFFGCRHLFPDFASQNQEKDVYIQI
jgi:hypothetical protein